VHKCSGSMSATAELPVHGLLMMRSKTISTRWSSCSKDQLVKSLDEDLDYCLHNLPETVNDRVADCGNGIVDPGEQCDCGNAPASVCYIIFFIFAA